MAEITADLLARREAILKESVESLTGERAEIVRKLEGLDARLLQLEGQIAETHFWAMILAAESVSEAEDQEAL